MAGIKIKFDALTDDAFRKVDGLYRKISQGPGKTPTGQQQIQSLMSEMVRNKQAAFASFGGQEFPIEKQVQKFGANLKQARQGMSELAVANKSMLRGMSGELKKFNWDSIHTTGQGGINWKQFMMGLAVAPFSPWLGARGMSAALPAGGKGGGGGGISAAIFGGGGMGAFSAFFIGIHAAGTVLREFVSMIKGSIHEGSTLYRESAKTGMDVERMFSLQSAAKAIGISESQMDSLLLRGQYPTKSGHTGSVFGEIMSAGKGVSQIGGLQQFINMGQEFEGVRQNSMLDAKAWKTMAKDFQDIASLSTEVGREFKTLVAQIVDIFGDEIKTGLQWIGSAFKAANMDILLLRAAVVYAVKGKAGAEEFMKGGGNKFLPGQVPFGSQSGTHGAWEKMGFVIGGFGSQNYAKETAENTRKTVEAIHRLPEVLQKINSGDKFFNWAMP